MLEFLVNGEQKFGNKEIIQSNVDSEIFFVASDSYEELPWTCGADTFVPKKDLTSSGKKLELRSHAVEVGT
jgi:hypothetical protein